MPESTPWRTPWDAGTCSTGQPGDPRGGGRGAARACPGASRYRLHRQERRHRDGGRVQGPDCAGPAVAGRFAHRDRGQGRGGGQVAGNDLGADHAAAPGGFVPDGVRDDGHGGDAIAGVPAGVRAPGGDHSDQPADDPGGSSGRDLSDEGGERAGGGGGDPQGSCDRPTGAGGHGERGRFGAIECACCRTCRTRF